MNVRPTQLYLEDFTAGQQFDGATRFLSNEDVLGFSSLTGDAHPLHYDPEYAKKTRFGRPIVHGLHLMSLTALGATPLASRLEDAMVAFLEQGSNFLKPVFVGDTVCSSAEVMEVDPRSDRDWGRVKFRVKLTNQHDETVLDAFHVYRLRRRTVAEADVPQ